MTTKALALVFDSDEGPYADATSYLALDATGTGTLATGAVRAKVTAGVDAGVGGTLKPFHVTLVESIEAPRFQREWVLFNGAVASHP